MGIGPNPQSPIPYKYFIIFSLNSLKKIKNYLKIPNLNNFFIILMIIL